MWSASKSPNGGIPQGTKLSPILFAVMVDDLVRSWGPRIKYVDDLTILEVIPRNSPSVMKYLVNDVNSFAHCNNMQLNPSKCKLMRVDVLHYNSCYSQPILGFHCHAIKNKIANLSIQKVPNLGNKRR